MAQRSAFVYSPASSESCERRTGSRRLFGLVQLAQRWQSSAGSPSEEKKQLLAAATSPPPVHRGMKGGGVAQKAPEGRRRPVLVNKAPGTSRTQRARRSRRGRAGRGVRWARRGHDACRAHERAGRASLGSVPKVCAVLGTTSGWRGAAALPAPAHGRHKAGRPRDGLRLSPPPQPPNTERRPGPGGCTATAGPEATGGYRGGGGSRARSAAGRP